MDNCTKLLTKSRKEHKKGILRPTNYQYFLQEYKVYFSSTNMRPSQVRMMIVLGIEHAK